MPASLGFDVIAEALIRTGKTAAQCAALVASVTEDEGAWAPILEMKRSLKASGIPCDEAALERVLLSYAMEQSLEKIDNLPVPVSVRELIRKQFEVFRQPTQHLDVEAEEKDPFISACKICTLRRFPAGPLDWVISGVPRSWFFKMPLADVPSTLRFIVREFGGMKPAFYVHIAHPPRNRALIIEKEVRRSYYRMAQSLELQPQIRGIMCATWLHDPTAIEMYPHVAAFNEPYLSGGGRLLTNLGPAPVASGFLKFNSARREQYEQGKLKLKTVVAMWPRKAALEWASRNRNLES